MTSLLIHLFTPKGDPNKNAEIRAAYGTLGSFTGMGVNLLLAAIKLFAGVLSGSLAIVSDGVNNLTDMLSCLFTFVGFRLSRKPADHDHPFGHGRYEYLTGLGVGILILMVGVELLKTAAKKIMHPEPVAYSALVAVLLLVSVAAKVWLGFFYRNLGKRISSVTFFASAKDSFSDCLITTVTFISLLCSRFSSVPIDGYLSALLSLWILWMGIKTLRETSSPILGKAPDPEMISTIRETLLAAPFVSGVHDLLLHDYGPGQVFGTAHAEVPSVGDIHALHESIDQVERQIYDTLGVNLTVHLDPMSTGEEPRRQKELLTDILAEIHAGLSIHDFHTKEEEGLTVLLFDLSVPSDCTLSHDALKAAIDSRLQAVSPRYRTRIFFDADV